MATAVNSAAPSRDDFAKMLEESFTQGSPQEGNVGKGTVVAIEKDVAVIDVGAKTEGRVALREFAGPGRQADIKVGDTVEVYLERVENALGEAVLSRDKARREESWGKLEKAFNANEKVHGMIFNQVKGGFTVDLDGAVAFLPRSQVDIRPIRDVSPLMNQPQPFQILKMDRRRGNIVVSRRTVLEETRAEIPGGRAVQGPRHQHHRLRRLRGARTRHRRAHSRLRDVVDEEERAPRQDRIDLPGGGRADPRGRSGQAAHLARPQADHAQSVGGLCREISARRRDRGRGQEQD